MLKILTSNGIFIILFIYLFSFTSNGQLFKKKGLGTTVGLTINLGTHINRFGFNLNAFYYYKFIQVNGGFQFNLNLTSWEGFKLSKEVNSYIGAQFYFGKEVVNNQFLIHEVSLNSGKSFGFGYTYKYYWSSIGTSQVTGLIGIHINDISFIVENDFFGFKNQDKYRTSSVGLMFRIKDFELGIQNIIWTGETKGVNEYKDINYNSKSGVKDISKLKYGKFSYGVLAIKFNYSLPFGQVFNASIGLDSESIRHVFQNKFAHGILNYPHYPIKDKDGNSQYKTKLPKRKEKLYFQFGVNNVGFY